MRARGARALRRVGRVEAVGTAITRGADSYSSLRRVECTLLQGGQNLGFADGKKRFEYKLDVYSGKPSKV